MFFGFGLLIFAEEFHPQIYTFELKKGFTMGSIDYKTSQAKIHEKRDLTLFKFEVNCGNIDKDICDKANKESSELASLMEKVLDIKRNIVILIQFISFCETVCNNETIARSGPSTYFALSRNPVILYPQSLVKQLANNSNSLAYSKYDAVINFNSDSDRLYYETFEDGSQNNQYSFKFIVSHECMHGLGVVTSFDEYIDISQFEAIQTGKSNYPVTASSKLLSPAPNNNNLNKKIKRDLNFLPKGKVESFSNFQFINLYDTCLVDARTNFKVFDIFMKYFYNSPTPLPIQTLFQASSLYKGATLRYAIMFDTGSEQFPMDTTFANFSSGSSMSHLDQGLGPGSLDELMWSIAQHDKTIDLKGSSSSSWGYYQLKMLQTMGYPLKIDPETVPKSISYGLRHICSIYILIIHVIN